MIWMLVLAGTAALLVVVLLSLNGTDVGSHLAASITRRAVRCFTAKETRRRYAEEWAAELLDLSGPFRRLAAACGYVLAAVKMRNLVLPVPQVQFRGAAADLAWAPSVRT